MADLKTTFTDIANAIRAKGGTTDKIVPTDMATAITNLPSGGGEKNYTVGFDVAKHSSGASPYILLDKYIVTSPEEDIISVSWKTGGYAMASYMPEYDKTNIILSNPNMSNEFTLSNKLGDWRIKGKYSNSFQSDAMVFYKIYNK